MSLYHSTDCDGVSELRPDRERMREIIAQLDDPDIADADHPDVSLTNDSNGWSITFYASGIATYENLDADDSPPKYLPKISRAEALKLWCDLAAGKLDWIESHAWIAD
ncbi:hypothetical protein [Coraliomargarita akajimensis]|uniref:Immunity protein Imm1 n=1 Tax=Coraliomargarita akajimensis (strain DSM 45221 / IAM 15411 / JCM 23193 / KCTC 12865 / 04OKA010-24) TaxID=583355 RepID=D5EQ29_CORAD|nr:hypothetical protein [Coraliomargarita akajimensis]ADE53797.1 hypothetical protein Caka_0773 [Coraliomargarita akajimensis DSM 45221]